MSTFREIALPLAARGFRVFPLIPRQKRPLSIKGEADHFDVATTDPAQIEAWNAQKPDANVGIAPDEIFCFLETDDLNALWDVCQDLPPELWDTAGVSARPNRCYFIYRQTARTRRVGNMTLERKGQENLFEFKQHRVYVVGPGSIHPKTGGPYTAEWREIPAMPDVLLARLCDLAGAEKPTAKTAMSAETQKQTELLDRFLATYEVATVGDWFNKGKSWYRPIECPWLDEHENDNQGTSTCVVFTEGGGYGFDCKHRCADKGWREFRAELERRHPDRRFSFVEPDCTVTIGSGTVPKTLEPEAAPKDWRLHYHTFEQMENAPPPAFLITGFLQKDGITALAAPVGQRKSLIALNVAHALCTGEPLFGHFKVTEKPDRVLYLCPEMGISSFTDRVRRIGLMSYVGRTLFCRTMSAVGTLELNELTAEELKGAAVIIDTAVRYLKGDENSSEHMRAFAEGIFRLMRDGALSVFLLHHSAKGTKESSELTLENAMRGSGELGAFVASCWATRLQDPSEEYESPSFLTNVKQRDYESKPFEVTSSKITCKLTIVSPPDKRVKLSSKTTGAPANADGKEDTALQVIRDNPKLAQRALVLKLKELGIKRSKSWVGDKRYELLQKGELGS